MRGYLVGNAGVSIALFTRDLRVHDNPVLSAAAAAARVVPLFVLDEAIIGSDHPCPNRAAFLAESLADLDAGLRELGGRLVVRRGSVVAEVSRVAEEVGADEVHVAADVSGYAQRRLQALHRALSAEGRDLVVHEAVITAVPAGEVTPQGKDHFAVFTPYYRRWSTAPKRRPLGPPSRLAMPRLSAGRIPSAAQLCAGETSPDRPVGGEGTARRLFDEWTRSVRDYADDHDDLAADNTSRLSPYLHFGCLSPVELVDRVGTGDPGAEAFVRQVAWRDFHHQVLAARPAASQHDYRSRGDRWRHDERALEAWKQGRTGYPIIDAGMRQLAREGWMHNRARLIAGSFLTKTLYIDWRWGARHFLDLLVDGDIANNQMNWQWVAGTGTDTRPNRVLNPLAQAKRYDPNGDYVRRYVPELRGIDGGAVHQPWRLDPDIRRRLDYPEPIVDLDEGAERFRTARRA
ncbi:cryptochrome/photolyase family protein [Saccharopolyspora elongata]|uniref:cryptochrome/photolyase family protein n=1 Tax=Saccharopolyspora elongata TaxID=2530387 RepID=UPI0026D6F39D